MRVPVQAHSVRAAGGENKLASEVRVWHADLDVDADRLAALARTLSADEAARAARFTFARDRRRFVAARGILRERLAEATGVEPARVDFAYGPHGKPYLCGAAGSAGLFFNLAHSGGHVLIGMTTTAEIGVDIEVIRPVRDAAAIGRRCFSEDEREALERVDAADRDAAFFHAWTRKEAFIKAVGVGLSYPLQSFDVTLTPGEPARILRAPDQASTWSIRDLSCLPAFAAAIVVTAPAARLPLAAGSIR